MVFLYYTAALIWHLESNLAAEAGDL